MASYVPSVTNGFVYNADIGANGVVYRDVTTSTAFDPRLAADAVRDQLDSLNTRPSRKNPKEKPMPSKTKRVGVLAAEIGPDRAIDGSQLIATNVAKVLGGTVGQVLVLGTVVWQSDPFLDSPDDASPSAEDNALTAALGKVKAVLETLFAPPAAQPTGFAPIGAQSTGA